MNEIETLEQYALDHYEDGGHWIYETFSASDYAQALAEAGSLQAAKKAIKREWETLRRARKELRLVINQTC
jgi:soluble cytochrome b562